MTLRVKALLGGALLVAATIGLAGSAAADEHTPVVSGSACVTDTEFRMHIEADQIAVSTNLSTNGDIRGDTGTESFRTFLALSGGNTATFIGGTAIVGTGNRWATGSVVSRTVSASASAIPDTDENDDYYDIVFDAVVLHGSNPYVAGDTWGPAGSLDSNLGAVVFSSSSLPITDCDQQSTTTTSSTSTTTTSSTVPPTVAPTSIVSTTIPEVETDVANGGGSTPVVPLVIGVAFLTLLAVGVRARRLER